MLGGCWRFLPPVPVPTTPALSDITKYYYCCCCCCQCSLPPGEATGVRGSWRRGRGSRRRGGQGDQVMHGSIDQRGGGLEGADSLEERRGRVLVEGGLTESRPGHCQDTI